MGYEPSLGSEPALSNTTLNSSCGRSIHSPWPVPPAASRGQAQAVTTVPEQLCHLILGQATEAVIATQGGHRRGHVLVFRVQRAEAEPRHPEVLQRKGTMGGGQPSRRKPAPPTSLPSRLPDTPRGQPGTHLAGCPHHVGPLGVRQPAESTAREQRQHRPAGAHRIG